MDNRLLAHGFLECKQKSTAEVSINTKNVPQKCELRYQSVNKQNP